MGIETSCDETGAAVVNNGWLVRSNIVASSLKDHQQYGGIIPEIASRRQLELIHYVVCEALDKSKLSLQDVDCIAVTRKPGLIGSLLVGISFARALSYSLGKPLVDVDHIKAHIYANFLRFESEKHVPLPQLPAIGLVVSGGHSSLYHVKDYNRFDLLGQTKDDAVGEAFDKVARILDLGYPGGPVIDRLAKQGINKELRFPRAAMPNSYDFSFSGVKTAVYNYVNKNKSVDGFDPAKVAYSFQESVVDVLVDKSLLACQRRRIKSLLIGGGVAANSTLRERMFDRAKSFDVQVYFPAMSFCLDNAAMIAGLGYRLFSKPRG
ncbi:MAG: tRNA (adenosine(37)-N6)-threonylcarbamoyltransferase complex transferase subunit TsaD [Candidatus Omnitrophica bacterium]|nr:tRNA (adenosine(37)-N6)-threonylcarbamoyltransferase complex transferase subunit TsaD [Candidatus Omnitrophota bacterium]